MRTWRGRKRASRVDRPVIATIGMFDGVHRGHQRLIRRAVSLAARHRGRSVLITFDPDPQAVLTPHAAPPPLMTLQRRAELARQFGIDAVWVIPFTRRFAQTSPEQFVRQVLLGRLRASRVVVGSNFAFGRHRQGDPELLRMLGRRYGLKVDVMPPVMVDGAPVSSSRIRHLVTQGRMAEARRLLGRPYELSGRVVRGTGRATRLGFPTANLRLDAQLLPPNGVYAVVGESATRRFRGVMNLGIRPTFLAPMRRRSSGHVSIACEVHLLKFHQQLYGRRLRVTVFRRLRNERRFANPRALAQQIQRDIERARRLN